mmetsp:Transcript_48804/g.139635  ORF Transcript_48804/g.139635 Transcript_48804/m.139635 type:complete len:269 (+) Transcript_48804:3426-4232(+)
MALHGQLHVGLCAVLRDAPALGWWRGRVLLHVSEDLIAPDAAPEPPAAGVPAVPVVPVVKPDGLAAVAGLPGVGPTTVVLAHLHVLAEQRLDLLRGVLLLARCEHEGLRGQPLARGLRQGPVGRPLGAWGEARGVVQHLRLGADLGSAEHVRLRWAVDGAAPAPLRRRRRHGLVARPDLAAPDLVAEPPARKVLAVPHVPEEEHHLRQRLLLGVGHPPVDPLAVVGALLRVLAQDRARGRRQDVELARCRVHGEGRRHLSVRRGRRPG